MNKLLVEYRADKSQFEMAQKYGVTQQTWSNWERGVSVPSIITMKVISEDAGYSIEELFLPVKD